MYPRSKRMAEEIVLEEAGNTEQPLVRYNTSTDFGRSVITPAVEEFVRQQYADDYRLWNTLNGAA